MQTVKSRSIIASLARQGLEVLLLSAALANTNVMQTIIDWNARSPIKDAYTVNAVRRSSKPGPSEMVAKAKPAKKNISPSTHTIVPVPEIIVLDSEDDGGASITQPQISTQQSTPAKKIGKPLKTPIRRSQKRRISPPPPPPPEPPHAKLTGPLSELTKDWDMVPVDDIQAYVNRPTSVRHSEIENSKHLGRVGHPASSCILNSMAYRHQAKEYGLIDNVHGVGQLCLESWAVETKEVKETYAVWEKIERMEHAKAHLWYQPHPKEGRWGVQLAVMGTEYLEDPPEPEDVQYLTPFGSTPDVSSTGGMLPSLPG
jgi:hypothetical protein